MCLNFSACLAILAVRFYFDLIIVFVSLPISAVQLFVILFSYFSVLSVAEVFL